MRNKIDILNRRAFVERLASVIRQLADSGNGCTFAIDGLWGSGKSYVLDMLERELSLLQHPDAAGDRYILFRYNCWQYDYYDEPAIAIIAAIRDACEACERLLPHAAPQAAAALETILETVRDLGKDLVCNVIETKLGWSPEALMDLLGRYGENVGRAKEEMETARQYDAFFDFRSILEKTREQLSKMAEDKPIVIIVDELDRCVPEYAVKVLERLHHLFEDQPNIVVVLAYDGSKLEHVIQRIYGIEQQDIRHFMRKFISFSMYLDNGQVSDSFWTLYQNHLNLFDQTPSFDRKDLSAFTAGLFQGIDARTQEKIMERIALLHRFSFRELSHPSILYFELLHQVISDKCASIPGFSIGLWLSHLDSNASPYQEAALALGTRTYAFLKEQEKSVRKSGRTITFDSVTRYLYLSCTPLSLAFWYLTALACPIDDKTCGHYYLNDAPDYQDIVDAAKNFHDLSRVIR